MADAFTEDTLRIAVNKLSYMAVPTPTMVYDSETTTMIPTVWDKWILTRSIHDEWIAIKKKPLIVIMVDK